MRALCKPPPRSPTVDLVSSQVKSWDADFSDHPPINARQRFGGPSGSWTNKLIFGENLQALKELLEMKAHGELVNEDGSKSRNLRAVRANGQYRFSSKRHFCSHARLSHKCPRSPVSGR